MTLLDESKRNKIIALERERNIKAINKELLEARALRDVLMTKNDPESYRERRIVASQITQLEAFLRSENNALIEATDDEVYAVLRQLTF
ncbi:MAG: hypothetical protein QM305_09700 [Bacteroidota bacterium]|nr:hypothetical protein [Bacteroidota bacterium]